MRNLRLAKRRKLQDDLLQGTEEERRRDRTISRALWFLHGDFHKRLYAFEAWKLLQKALVVCFTSTLAFAGVTTQSQLVLLLLMVSTLVQALVMPYKDSTINTFELCLG